MKKTIGFVFAAFAILCAFSSCYKQDDVYREFIKIGGYVYPAKAVNLSATAGHSRVILSWERPMDPAVKSAIVYWDNYTNSLDIDYNNFPDGKVSVNIADLEDRSYTFDVVNFDSNGNKSLASELTVSAYGDSWLVTHSERVLRSAEMVGDNAHIELSKSTDEMVATQFRYINTNGEWVVYEKYMLPGETEIDLPNAMRGKKFEYRSGYCPPAGLDTVFTTSWVKSARGILYDLDTKGWKVTVTADQVNGSFTPEKIFDGVTDQPADRWHSSTATSIRKNFPKVLAIDTGASQDKEPTLCGFTFWEHPESQSYRYAKTCFFYVGDEPFNPDDPTFQLTYEENLVAKVSLARTDAIQTGRFTELKAGRYMAIAFIDSYNTNGYVDLWEYAPKGYIEGESE